MTKASSRDADLQAQVKTAPENVISALAAYRSNIITPEQLRGARGFMDWSRAELAEAAKISPETIKNIEFGTFEPQPGTLSAILQAFADNGIQFLNLSIFAPYTITGVFRVATVNAGEQS
jgi:DNA-binding XRE family transcriptional regulator